MATRIRYTNNNGVLVSKPMLSPAGELVVNISPDGSFVINTTTGTIVNVENAKSDLAKAKKLAKEALKSLGVMFENEVRPRLIETVDVLNEDAKKQYESEGQ